MQLLFDYQVLRVICWAFLEILLIGFVVIGSFDLAAGILLPFLAKGDGERGLIVDAVNSYGKGGQVFLLLAGAVLYAAWPIAFSVSLHSPGFVLLCLVFVLLLGALGFVLRNKIHYKKLRCYWDKVLFMGSLLTVFVLGMVFGNLLTGLPFYFDASMDRVYVADIDYLFSSFSLLTGLLSISMITMHGAVYLRIRLQDKIRRRANRIVFLFTLITLFLFALAGCWAIDLEGYHLVSEIFPNAETNPMASEVKSEQGLWLDNYGHLPGLWRIPAMVFVSGLISIVLVRVNREKSAFIFSSITVAAIILTAACSMFPFLIPSSVYLNSSLTVWDSSASQETLMRVFWYAMFCLPLMILYLFWFFRRRG